MHDTTSFTLGSVTYTPDSVAKDKRKFRKAKPGMLEGLSKDTLRDLADLAQVPKGTTKADTIKHLIKSGRVAYKSLGFSVQFYVMVKR